MKKFSFLVGQPTNKKLSQSDLENLIITQMRILEFVQTEQRHQRSDLKDINGKLDRLLVDKHLQMQVDEYFKDNPDGNTDDNH